jgi:hypothetical protein
MPDTETAETAPPAPPAENSKPAPAAADRLPDDHPLVKAYQATKGDLAAAKSKVKEFEDATKSEQEKLTERASELEKNLSEAAVNAARFEIALEKGLTKSQAKRLVGSTREELEADAEELLADLGLNDEKPAPARRPQERLKPGAAPEAEPEETDPAKLAEAVQKAKYGL